MEATATARVTTDDGDDHEGDGDEAQDLVRPGDQHAALAAGGARDAAEPQARAEAPQHRQDQVHGGDDRGGGRRAAAPHQRRRDAPPRGPRRRHGRDGSVGVGHGGERAEAKP